MSVNSVFAFEAVSEFNVLKNFQLECKTVPLLLYRFFGWYTKFFSTNVNILSINWIMLLFFVLLTGVVPIKKHFPIVFLVSLYRSQYSTFLTVLPHFMVAIFLLVLNLVAYFYIVLYENFHFSSVSHESGRINDDVHQYFVLKYKRRNYNFTTLFGKQMGELLIERGYLGDDDIFDIIDNHLVGNKDMMVISSLARALSQNNRKAHLGQKKKSQAMRDKQLRDKQRGRTIRNTSKTEFEEPSAYFMDLNHKKISHPDTKNSKSNKNKKSKKQNKNKKSKKQNKNFKLEDECKEISYESIFDSIPTEDMSFTSLFPDATFKEVVIPKSLEQGLIRITDFCRFWHIYTSLTDTQAKISALQLWVNTFNGLYDRFMMQSFRVLFGLLIEKNDIYKFGVWAGFDVLNKMREWNVPFDTNFQPKYESISSTIRGVRETAEVFFDSSVARKIKEFIICLSTLDFISKDKMPSFLRYFAHGEVPTSGVPLFTHILHCIETIFHFGENLISGVSLSESLRSTDPYSALYSRINDLLEKEPHLISDDSHKGRESYKNFLCDCEQVIRDSNNLIKKSFSFKESNKNLRRKLEELERSYETVLTRYKAMVRDFPFGVVVFGAPGVGKSTVIDMLHRLFQYREGQEYNKRNVFYRVRSSDYWEGFNELTHNIIHYSELGNEPSNIVKNRGDPMLVELNSVMDRVPMMLDFAFSDKGKVYVNSKYITVDTNNPDLNLNEATSNPAALKRRFHFLEVRVKREYAHSNGSIDHEKIGSDVDPLDIYSFDLFTYRACSAKETEYVPLLRCATSSQLVYELTKIMDSHFSKQNELSDKLSGDSYFDSFFKANSISHEGFFFNSFSRRFIMNDVRLLKECSFDMLVLVLLCACRTLFSKDISPLVHKLVLGGFTLTSALFLFNSWYYTVFVLILFSLILKFVFSKLYSYIDEWVNAEISCRTYDIESKLFCTKSAMNPYVSKFWKVHGLMVKNILCVLSSIAASYTAYQVGKKVASTFTSKTEEDVLDGGTFQASSFFTEDGVDLALRNKEQMFHCGSSYKRIFSKDYAVWNDRHYEPAVFNNSLDEFRSLIDSNIRYVHLGDREKPFETHILGIKGNIALINSHALRDKRPISLRVSNTGNRYDFDSYIETLITGSRVFELENDISLVELSGVRFKDITKFLRSYDDVPDKGECSIKGWKHFYEKHPPFTIKEANRTSLIENIFTYALPGHRKGDCGSPLIVALPKGYGVAGIHFAGNDNSHYAYAAGFKVDQILDHIKSFERLNGIPVRSSTNIDLELGDPISKSALRFENLHNLKYYGKIPGPVMVKNKSKLIHTPFSKHVPDAIYRCFGKRPDASYSQPLMQSRFYNGEYINPINVNLKKLNTSRVGLDWDILLNCKREFLNHIVYNIPHRKLSPLDFETAINGCKDDPFLRRINAQTSAGFGFKGKKSDHLPIFSESAGQLTREMSDELKRCVNEMIDKYLNGDNCNVIYDTQLKDEPRPLEKCLEGKTRMFYMGPVDSLILSRMFLYPIYSLLIEFGDIFCSAVGINSHTGFDKMIRDLLDHSPFFVEGDFKAFDTSVPFDISRITCALIYDLCVYFGYNDDALKVVAGILNDSLFPWVLVLKDLFELVGRQPSGKYATAEDNCLKLMFLLMYVYYWLKHPPNTFFKKVKPKTYGDDFQSTVSRSIIRTFNGQILQKYCKELFNMEMTSPRKDSNMPKYVEVHEATFLKRTFCYRKDLDKWVGKLDINSINKSLVWYIPSNSATKFSQLTSTFTSMLYEAFLHLEEPKFNEFRQFAISCIQDAFDLELDLKLFPQYDEIREHMFPLLLDSSSPATQGDPDSVSFEVLRRGVYPHDNCASLNKSTYQSCGNYSHIVVGLGIYKSLANIHNKISKEVKACVNALSESSDIAQLLEICDIYIPKLRTLLIEMDPLFPNSMRVLSKNKAYISRTKINQNVEFKTKVALLSFIDDLRATKNVCDLLESTKKFNNVQYESGEVGEQDRGPVDSDVKEQDENFQEVTGDPLEVVSMNKPLTDNIGISTMLSPDKFFSRPVEIANITIPVSTSVDNSYDIWDVVSRASAVRAKFRNYAYFKGNVCIRVTISGSPFHYGRLLFSYQPYADYNSALVNLLSDVSINPVLRPHLLCYLSQSKERWYMDVRDNQPVEITIPFISYKPAFKLYNTSAVNTAVGSSTPYEDFAEAGRLYVYSLNQISAVSTSPSDVSMQIYAWFCDVELGCPTATQLAISTESGTVSKDERKVGPVEVISSKIAQASDMLTKVPVIGKVAKISSVAFGAISKVSSVFGWSRPSIITEPSFVKNNGYTNGAHSIGSDTAFRITFDPEQEVSVDPSLFGDSSDEMFLNYITNVESYIDTFTWSPSDGIMTNNIWFTSVMPQDGIRTVTTILGRHYFQPTALCFAAQPFSYWRGDIIYRFDFVCSAYHRGKVAIVFEPNGSQYSLINADTEFNKQYMLVVDLQETQSIEVCVRWNSYRSWLQTRELAFTNPRLTAPTNVDYWAYSNGYIAVMPFTELQSPDDSSIQVNVFTRSENIKFNALRGNEYPAERITLESGQVTGTGSKVEPKGVSCVELAPSSADMSAISHHYFGEQPASFRSLLKRYSPVSYYGGSGLTPQTPGSVSITFPILPGIRPSYGSSTSGPLSLFSYLRYAYLAYKGGLKRRIILHCDGSDNVYNLVRVHLDNSTDTTSSPAISVSSSGVESLNQGLVTYVPHSNGGIEVELPFYSNNLFGFSSLDTGVSSGTSLGQMWQSVFRNYSVSFDFATTPTEVHFLEDLAIGEDFSFFRFIGAPYYTTS
jgi:hypothetical protein